MLIEWEGININNFGFGASFLEEPGKSFIVVVPYVDENGNSQQPRFLLHPQPGSIVYPIRLWISELYRMVIKIQSPIRTKCFTRRYTLSLDQ